MKKLILTLTIVFMVTLAMAQERANAWLEPVEAQYVCMVNNQSYDSLQIAVKIEDKTYYGCCPMCKAKLERTPAIRTAIDPISGNVVDKAKAVIGTGANKTVYYFENEENFQAFSNRSMPETDSHNSYNSSNSPY